MEDLREEITVSAENLPLYCSGPDNESWNGHPKVFLPVGEDGKTVCPYCGTHYRITGEIPHHHYA